MLHKYYNAYIFLLEKKVRSVQKQIESPIQRKIIRERINDSPLQSRYEN